MLAVVADNTELPANAGAPVPDTDAAVAFLRRVHGGRPIHLTTIHPTNKTLAGRTFSASDTDAMRKWIAERQGKVNLYWSINSLRFPLGQKRNAECCGPKSAKTDIARLNFLQIDIDPKEGETPEQAKVRAKALLDKYHLPPSIVTDSGGGLQGVWALAAVDDELEVHGDLAKARELERVGRQIEADFGIDISGKRSADACHNIDRIFRVPGTINLPTTTKLAAGRVPSLARVLKCDLSLTYELGQFGKAKALGTDRAGASVGMSNGRGAGQRTSVPVPSGPMGTAELRTWAAAHGKTISDHTLALIATGQDPLNPTKYKSRSEALFALLSAGGDANMA